MFDLFKKKDGTGTQDVKSLRDYLLQFVKTTLVQLESGEGTRIKGIELFICPKPESKHLYEAALFTDDANRLQETIQKMANDFAINVPPTWQLSVSFTENFPDGVVQASGGDAAMFVRTTDSTLKKEATALLVVLSGEAEKEQYLITSEGGNVTIGRDKNVQTRDNFFRENTIAFPAESSADGNKYISRQHAHIEWDKSTQTFLLYADEGGVPPRNKIKIRPARGGDPVKLQSTKLGYSLQHGDQIILGETALLEFRTSPQ